MYKTNWEKLLLSSTLALYGLMRTVCVQRISKALFVRTFRWKHAVHSLPACNVFHNPDSYCFLTIFMGGLCVVYVWLRQTSVNENTTNLERVLYLCLTLDWRWSDVLMASTFTREKTLTFFSMQKMCALADAHKKMNDGHQAFLSNHQRILTHAQQITTHWPKFFIFCALDVRDWYMWLGN